MFNRPQLSWGVRRLQLSQLGQMIHWRLYHIVLLWVATGVLMIAAVAFDVWRVQSFAIGIPGRFSVWRIGAILRAAAPVLPIATASFVLLPVLAAGCTVWWALLHVRGG